MGDNETSILRSRISCPRCAFEKPVPIDRYRHRARLQCPRPDCGHRFTYRKNCVFDGHRYDDIAPRAFMHPLDSKAVAALRRVPGFDFALRKMMEFGYEKLLRVNAMADDVKVTPATCGYIHEMAVEAAQCLGIAVPDVFINQNPVPNASTFGVEYPLITIQSGIVDLLTDDELYAVIAHEMAHIKCHHVLYHMLADFLVNASGFLGVVGGFVVPLNLALLEWSRKAELSSDRGALLVTGNRDACIKLLMKLAGGSRQIAAMIDEAEFVDQARQFQNITSGIGLHRLYRVASSITRTHPFAVLRAHELHTWAAGGQYDAIRAGDYSRRSEEERPREGEENPVCPHCGKAQESAARSCTHCGQNRESLKNQYDESGYEAFLKGVKGGVKGALDYIGSHVGAREASVAPKRCPTCGAKFLEPDAAFCPVDGDALIDERHRG